MASELHSTIASGGDANILAAFDRYLTAGKVVEDGRERVDSSPEEQEMLAAAEALRSSGIPNTAAGLAAQLRHVMQFKMTAPEWHSVTLYGSPADRARFYRDHWSELRDGCEDDAEYIAGAIIALEGMANRESIKCGSSLILALQARYSAAWAEHHIVDVANGASSDGKIDLLCSRGMSALESESDALRMAILYQVPRTQEEAAVLSYHIWSLYEPGADLRDAEQNALAAGITAVFDFHMREGAADIDGHGKIFRDATMLAWNSVRYRTGQVEENA